MTQIACTSLTHGQQNAEKLRRIAAHAESTPKDTETPDGRASSYGGLPADASSSNVPFNLRLGGQNGQKSRGAGEQRKPLHFLYEGAPIQIFVCRVS
jgi:hypothetical protein